MNITSTTITKTATSTTDSANYEIEYTITDGTLARVEVRVFDLPKTEINRNYLGSIYMINNLTSCNITYKENLHLYFRDFEEYVNTIKENMVSDN